MIESGPQAYTQDQQRKGMNNYIPVLYNLYIGQFEVLTFSFIENAALEQEPSIFLSYFQTRRKGTGSCIYFLVILQKMQKKQQKEHQANQVQAYTRYKTTYIYLCAIFNGKMHIKRVGLYYKQANVYQKGVGAFSPQQKKYIHTYRYIIVKRVRFLSVPVPQCRVLTVAVAQLMCSVAKRRRQHTIHYSP